MKITLQKKKKSITNQSVLNSEIVGSAATLCSNSFSYYIVALGCRASACHMCMFRVAGKEKDLDPSNITNVGEVVYVWPEFLVTAIWAII